MTLVWDATGRKGTSSAGYEAEVSAEDGGWMGDVDGPCGTYDAKWFSTEAKARAWCEARVKERRDA